MGRDSGVKPRFKKHKKKTASFSKKSSPLLDVVYGKNPCVELLNSAKRPAKIIYLSKTFYHNSKNQDLIQKIKTVPADLQICDVEKLDHLCQGQVHQGIAIKTVPINFSILSEFKNKEKDLVLVLDQIQDPQNMGTLIRSAHALGVQKIIFTKNHAVPLTAHVCKASSGAIEYIEFFQVTNLARALQELKDLGFWIYGSALDESAQNLSDVQPAEKSAIVMGSEGKGMRDLIKKNCDVVMQIEMANGFESLNVAQAGSILMYHFGQKIGLLNSNL